MKKYLITGCAGFIGSNFVYYMLKKYDDILLINLDNANSHFLRTAGPHFPDSPGHIKRTALFSA